MGINPQIWGRKRENFEDSMVGLWSFYCNPLASKWALEGSWGGIGSDGMVGNDWGGWKSKLERLKALEGVLKHAYYFRADHKSAGVKTS